jgi:VIT1/CCC1 family predicted Fe2+/Mn2+ transporter
MIKTSMEWISRLREFVFGMQDGIVSTVGFLSGVQSAVQTVHVVIIAGLAQIFTGALSMAIGAYLSTEAEKEVLEQIRKGEDTITNDEPYLAQEELLKAFEEEGLKREEGYRIVSILRRNNVAFRKTFYEKVLGLGSPEFSRPLMAATVMYFSFLVGGLFPMLPYLIVRGRSAIIGSILCSGIALFGTGFFKGVLVKKSPVRSGAKFFLIALLSALAGYVVGLILGLPNLM